MHARRTLALRDATTAPMSAPASLSADEIDALRASVTRVAGEVRTLKASGAAPDILQAALAQLQALRAQLEAACPDGGDSGAAKWPVDKKGLDDCVLRRMFVVPSFEIHGSVGGCVKKRPIT